MSIRKKVANLWAPLLQSKGNSTTQPMSQKAVSDEFNQLKSDLVAKANMLSYEEIMASTPPIDLDIGIPKASALKHLKPIIIRKSHESNPSTSYVEQTDCRITIPANSIYGIFIYRDYNYSNPKEILISTYPAIEESTRYPLAYDANDGSHYRVIASTTNYASEDTNLYVYAKDSGNVTTGINTTGLIAWYITL